MREQDSVDNLVIDRDEEVKSDNRHKDFGDAQINNYQSSENITEEQSSHFDAINGQETGQKGVQISTIVEEGMESQYTITNDEN